MGTASFHIAGRRYDLACRDGEEGRFQALARIVDAKAVAAVGPSGGGVNEARQLLFASLLLADELQELRNGGTPAPAEPPAPDPTVGKVLNTVATRIEALAARLEKAGATS